MSALPADMRLGASFLLPYKLEQRFYETNVSNNKIIGFCPNSSFTREKIEEYLQGIVNNGDPIYQEVRPGVMAIGAYNGTGNIVGTLFGKKAAKWAVDSI